jgi:hypothetical protein
MYISKTRNAHVDCRILRKQDTWENKASTEHNNIGCGEEVLENMNYLRLGNNNRFM